MKLFIINGENNDEKIEININECLRADDIKYKLDGILYGNGKFTKDYFTLIYKNIILFDDNSIKHYKICKNDKIWFGKIENYLRKDDVIVDVFILGGIYDSEHLIMKMSDTISIIRSIIERIHSEIINIWNADGKQMRNDQIVTEIDTNENYKLIIRCDDGEGNKINNTFDECCYLHDRNWVDGYLLIDQIRDDNKNESTRKELTSLTDQISKQIISSNDKIDDKLNPNLSDLPSSFLDSINLFSFEMTYRITDICNDYWRFMMNQYDNDVVRIFDQYFQFAIRAALGDFSNIRQQINNKTNKSVRHIVIDGLDYFEKYLIDSSNDWQYWLKLWMNQYLLRSFSDSRLNKRIDKCTINNFKIKIRINGKNINNFIPYKPETILKAKQSISTRLKVDMKDLYCIRPGGDDKLNDEDKFDDEFIIEIVLSMEDIEILRLLGRGGFAKIYLCRDKKFNKQIPLKKKIRIDEDLHRDINIYSKLNSSRNIMNYSGLFRDGESICICMEYMSGGSLRSYLDKGGHLSEQEILKISIEILTQINELHKLGIIHGDIKSDNIVVDEDNHGKLIDFGISKYKIGLASVQVDKEYKPEIIRYMAPELIKEEPYSEKIDIWSFGMVMVEMVTGERPFHQLNEDQLILHIPFSTKYELETNFPISNKLNQFINSCLNTDPSERPSAEQLIKSELFIDY